MTRNSPNTDTATAELKDSRLPVVIFGSGVVGEVLFQMCRTIGVSVACFCDNNANKAKDLLCGLPIVHAPQLKSKYPAALFLISAADIGDVVPQLEDMGYGNWYPASIFLRNFDFYQFEFSAPISFVEYAVTTTLLCQDNYLSNKIFLRSVDVIITERCSLKCRDCSNLMQYYQKPVDCDLKQIFSAIASLCAIVDEINEFRVIGGEPFMNRNSHQIVRKLAEEAKVRKIVIYTNGTIVPSDDQLSELKNEKVVVIITDYGRLSKNIQALKTKLAEREVVFYSHAAKGWTDCSLIGKNSRTPEQQEKIFKTCCSKNTFTLSGNKFFRCPFAANAYRLGAIPDNPGDYFDVPAVLPQGVELESLRDKFRGFVFSKNSFDACDYCSGRPFGAPEIAPAIQLSAPKEYKKIV